MRSREQEAEKGEAVDAVDRRLEAVRGDAAETQDEKPYAVRADGRPWGTPHPCRGWCDECLDFGLCYSAIIRWKGHT